MWVTIAIAICRLILRIEATEVKAARLVQAEAWWLDTGLELKSTDERSDGDV